MGAIDDKYAALGGPSGFLRHPADEGAGSEEMNTPDGRGRCRDFTGGSIYWKADTEAHEVHGYIRIKWAQLGGSRGFLGFPLTDELGAPDGKGRYSHFEGGCSYWKPETHAHEVHGPIKDKWASMGWERSRLVMKKRHPMDSVGSATSRVAGSYGHLSAVQKFIPASMDPNRYLCLIGTSQSRGCRDSAVSLHKRRESIPVREKMHRLAYFARFTCCPPVVTILNCSAGV